MAYSGGRPGEARQARWQEFNFETKTWTVPWQHLKTGRRYKTDKQVSITKPMDDVLMQAAQIAYPKDSSKIGDYHKKRGPIFQHARHAPDVSPDAVRVIAACLTNILKMVLTLGSGLASSVQIGKGCLSSAVSPSMRLDLCGTFKREQQPISSVKPQELEG